MQRLLFLLSFVAGPALAAPLLVAPPPGAEQIAAALEQPVGGRLFGLAVPFAVDSREDGVWLSEGQSQRWRLSLQAPQARSISLHFSLAELPAGAELRLLAADGSLVQGPYRSRDIRDGELWTGMVPGERLELQLEAPADSAPRLVLAALLYGFREPLAASAKSGNCNIDVACPAAAGFAEQVRSTVLLQYMVGSNLVSCSGFLVNNARQDGTPYLLTADHCGIRASNDQTVQVYWRYQRASCTQPGGHGHQPPDPSFSQSGTEWLARGESSDFSLLVIGTAAEPRLPDPSFLPYWSGWDVGETPARSGAGVHHPSGDEKAISLFDTPLRPVTADIEGRQTRAWEVFWEQGTTEQGSSGSALWNEAGRAVGVLSGGLASCGNQGGEDFYGRFNVAWTEAPNCDRQLRHWLDPDGSGRLQLDGADASGQAAPRVPGCDGGVPSPGPTAAPQAGGGSGAPGLLMILALLAWRRRGGHVAVT